MRTSTAVGRVLARVRIHRGHPWWRNIHSIVTARFRKKMVKGYPGGRLPKIEMKTDMIRKEQQT